MMSDHVDDGARRRLLKKTVRRRARRRPDLRDLPGRGRHAGQAGQGSGQVHRRRHCRRQGLRRLQPVRRSRVARRVADLQDRRRSDQPARALHRVLAEVALTPACRRTGSCCTWAATAERAVAARACAHFRSSVANVRPCGASRCPRDCRRCGDVARSCQAPAEQRTSLLIPSSLQANACVVPFPGSEFPRGAS